MSTEPFFNGRNVFNITFGMFYVLLNCYFLFHVKDFFPAAEVDYWYKVFVSYGLMSVYIFLDPQIRKNLFAMSLHWSLLRIALFTVIGIILFGVTLGIIELDSGVLFNYASVLPMHLILVHAVLITVTESAFAQGFLDIKLGRPWSFLVIGAFHYGVWEGSFVQVMLGAGILFGVFSFVNYHYRASKYDVTPSIGFHLGYNLNKLVQLGGFL